jgi:hypothetical protein
MQFAWLGLICSFSDVSACLDNCRRSSFIDFFFGCPVRNNTYIYLRAKSLNIYMYRSERIYE